MKKMEMELTAAPEVTNVNVSTDAIRQDEQRKGKKVGRGLSDQQKALLLENVPDYLKSTGTGWLFWRYGELASNGYREKVPHDVDTGCFANINDVGGTLKDAINACGFWNGDGVGYSVIPTDHLVGWDFDNCFDPITGTIGRLG
jgi:hypothetical protein